MGTKIEDYQYDWRIHFKEMTFFNKVKYNITIVIPMVLQDKICTVVVGLVRMGEGMDE